MMSTADTLRKKMFINHLQSYYAVIFQEEIVSFDVKLFPLYV